MSKITEFRKSGDLTIYARRTDFDVYYKKGLKYNLLIFIKDDFKEYYGVNAFKMYAPNIKEQQQGKKLNLKGIYIPEIMEYIRKRFKDNMIRYIENIEKQNKIKNDEDIFNGSFEEHLINIPLLEDEFEEVSEPVAEEEEFSFDFEIEIEKEIETEIEEFYFEDEVEKEDDFIFDEPKKIDINLLKQELKEYFHIRHNEPEIVKYKPDRELLAKYEDLVKYILTMNEIQDNIDKIALCNEEIGKHEYQIHKNKIAIQELKNKSNELL